LDENVEDDVKVDENNILPNETEEDELNESDTHLVCGIFLTNLLNILMEN